MYTEDIKQLRTLIDERRETERALKGIDSRITALAEFLRNEVSYIAPAEAKKLQSGLDELFKQPKKLAPARKRNFNKSAYTLVIVIKHCPVGCTSGEVVAALKKSPHAAKFENVPTIYASLNKFVKRGFLKKSGDKFKPTPKGNAQVAEYIATQFKEFAE